MIVFPYFIFAPDRSFFRRLMQVTISLLASHYKVNEWCYEHYPRKVLVLEALFYEYCTFHLSWRNFCNYLPFFLILLLFVSISANRYLTPSSYTIYCYPYTCVCQHAASQVRTWVRANKLIIYTSVSGASLVVSEFCLFRYINTWLEFELGRILLT